MWATDRDRQKSLGTGGSHQGHSFYLEPISGNWNDTYINEIEESNAKVTRIRDVAKGKEVTDLPAPNSVED